MHQYHSFDPFLSLLQQLPPRKNFIRAISLLTGYLIRPHGDGCTLVYVSHNDPKGKTFLRAIWLERESLFSRSFALSLSLSHTHTLSPSPISLSHSLPSLPPLSLSLPPLSLSSSSPSLSPSPLSLISPAPLPLDLPLVAKRAKVYSHTKNEPYTRKGTLMTSVSFCVAAGQNDSC